MASVKFWKTKIDGAMNYSRGNVAPSTGENKNVEEFNVVCLRVWNRCLLTALRKPTHIYNM